MFDNNEVRFTTDAGIINRLGQELVGKQETAVAELIKNAYDADAVKVTLVFLHTTSPGGILLIEDDGLGMTREQLVNGFMRLSSNDKLVHPNSPRYGRRRAGRKGIGRFAVQRLGKVLILTTQTHNSDHALRLRIDWDDFHIGVDLDSVAIRINKVRKERPEGTTLTIEGLRESWSEAEIRRVYRYVSDILQPFPLGKVDNAVLTTTSEKYKPDPGFDVALRQQNDLFENTIASQNETIFANALAVIEGYVDAQGKAQWSIKSERYGISEKNDIGPKREGKALFATLRNVNFRAYYYIWLPELFPKLLFTPLVDLGRQQGGIRVYRNGFRVAPYGDRDDDWIQLDYSQGNRLALPPHGNQNFFGFIKLDDPNGELFEERSSREGLIENDAFKELIDFTYRSLIAGVQRIAEARKKKRTAGQTDWQREDVDAGEPLIDRARKLLERVKFAQQETIGTTQNDDNSSMTARTQVVLDDVVAAVDELNVIISTAGEQQAQLLEELGMLRVLASLGIVIGEFTHEIRQTLNAAQVNALDLAENFAARNKRALHCGVSDNKSSKTSQLCFLL